MSISLQRACEWKITWGFQRFAGKMKVEVGLFEPNVGSKTRPTPEWTVDMTFGAEQRSGVADEARRALEELESYRVSEPPRLETGLAARPARLAYAAGHVVRDPALASPEPAEQIDWAATLADREYLWSLGLGVAEAMDTAQRNQIGWSAAEALLEMTLAASRERKARGLWAATVGGAGADGLDPKSEPGLTRVIDEYIRQGEFIESRGGVAMLLASPLLARAANGPEDYVRVYGEVARALRGPLFVHWLGEMFAPDLAGYFPGDSFERIMEANAEKILGVKISLLDEAREVAIRRSLRRRGQIVLTGDDFNYPDLILGDGAVESEETFELEGRRWPIGDFSHALLGVFNAIAPVASAALKALSEARNEDYKRLMGGTRELGLTLFEAPTFNYKAGVIFLAFLNGRQASFSAIGDMHLARSAEHYLRVFKLADQCGGALSDPEAARTRLVQFFGSW